MPRCATRAGACSSTGSAAAANAACATGHDTPACRAASAGVIPRSATSAPACARVNDLQALHAEQHRRRILDHDARGFLMIMNLW
jgi:hypothetical protein